MLAESWRELSRYDRGCVTWYSLYYDELLTVPDDCFLHEMDIKDAGIGYFSEEDGRELE